MDPKKKTNRTFVANNGFRYYNLGNPSDIENNLKFHFAPMFRFRISLDFIALICCRHQVTEEMQMIRITYIGVPTHMVWLKYSFLPVFFILELF